MALYLEGYHRITTSLLLLGVSLAGFAPALAGSNDGWLDEQGATRLTNQMAKKGMMPATVDCRYSRNGPMNLSKFTFKRAPFKTTWRWYIGPPEYVASSEAEARNMGLHRTFSKKSRDWSTGQIAQCSIWSN
ncbi:hypothetical protein FJ872_32715 [Mesorhizobium sp. B2-5-9]|uniref:hypothetical protein n=1 Tax=Mesorhizobium sp. B2-5-9 TaxID=2589921 RepID=UPI001127B05F|nr:hypothetical protein [Mesorhizobium sp. B2-5-9]TPJ96081.1 hypothetical protein FJ872_32715 [Mesorhizobium sp. B2-5-9]